MDPLPTPAAGSAPTTSTKVKAVLGNLPRAEKPLSELLDLAVAEWKNRPQLTLEWLTQPEAQTLADSLRSGLREVGKAHDTLSPQVARLAQLDQMIDGGKEGKLKYVRKALALQYDEEDDGRPYYGEFGIEKVGNTYTLPRDRGKRAEALTKLVAALPKHNLGGMKYGTKYWAPIEKEYNDLQPKAAKASGNRSEGVSDKNQLRDQAENFLHALLLLLQANYPKTYKAERRQFGFLKESY